MAVLHDITAPSRLQKQHAFKTAGLGHHVPRAQLWHLVPHPVTYKTSYRTCRQQPQQQHNNDEDTNSTKNDDEGPAGKPTNTAYPGEPADRTHARTHTHTDTMCWPMRACWSAERDPGVPEIRPCICLPGRPGASTAQGKHVLHPWVLLAGETKNSWVLLAGCQI